MLAHSGGSTLKIKLQHTLIFHSGHLQVRGTKLLWGRGAPPLHPIPGSTTGLTINLEIKNSNGTHATEFAEYSSTTTLKNHLEWTSSIQGLMLLATTWGHCTTVDNYCCLEQKNLMRKIRGDVKGGAACRVEKSDGGRKKNYFAGLWKVHCLYTHLVSTVGLSL